MEKANKPYAQVENDKLTESTSYLTVESQAVISGALTASLWLRGTAQSGNTAET